MDILQYIDTYKDKKRRWLDQITSALNEHEQGWQILSVHPELLTNLSDMVRPGIFYRPVVHNDDYSDQAPWLHINEQLLEIHQTWNLYVPDEPFFNQTVSTGLFHLQGLTCVFDREDQEASVVTQKNHRLKARVEWTDIDVLPTMPSSMQAFFPGLSWGDVPESYYEWIEIVDNILYKYQPQYRSGFVQVGGHIRFIQDGDEETALSVYDTEHGDCGQAYACVEKRDASEEWVLKAFDQMC